MGLDVYLRRYDDFEDTQRREREYEARTADFWKAGMSETEQTEAHERSRVVGKELGLDEWGSDHARVHDVSIDSAAYPQHMFKIGYFRSSYNAGGLNRIVENAIGKPGLYWIFEPSDGPVFRPNWSRARERSLELIEEYRARLKADGGLLRADFEAPNSFVGDEELKSRCASGAAAVEILREQLRLRAGRDGGNAYSNRDGVFFLDEPLKITALVSGIGPLGTRGFYVINRQDSGDAATWYLQALEIVTETCDWVLARPNPEDHYLTWSA